MHPSANSFHLTFIRKLQIQHVLSALKEFTYNTGSQTRLQRDDSRLRINLDRAGLGRLGVPRLQME